MTTIELRNNLHHLVDSIDNENILQQFYDLMLKKRESKDGKLWNKLSKDEIDELLLANEECENPDNVIPHEEIKKQYSQWL